MDLVLSTISNTDGEILFRVMDRAIQEGNIIELSFRDATPFSSSFLNSSFGALWEKFGDNTLKGRVRIVNFQPTRRDQVINYLSNLRQVAAQKAS